MDMLWKVRWSPNKFVFKKDVPVKWIINGKEITGCNSAITGGQNTGLTSR